MAGLAVAFPVAIGTALVLGTVLTYWVQRAGDPTMLTIGVLLALVAIVADSLAYRELAAGELQISGRSIRVCLVAGVLMGIWSPFTAASMAPGPGQLTPYTSTVFFTLAALLSTIPFNLYFMHKPLIGEPIALCGYFEGGWKWHWLGIIGGFVWCLGTAFNLIAGRATGFAAAYAIGQSAPMVAAFWGSSSGRSSLAPAAGRARTWP